MGDDQTHPGTGPKPGEITPVEFSEAVVADLHRQGKHQDKTLVQYVPVVEHYGAFLQNALGITRMDDVETAHSMRFVEAPMADGSPPTYSTRRVRKKVLHRAHAIGWRLRLVRGDPTIAIHLGPELHLGARPLTDEEVEVCRAYAKPTRDDVRRSIAWALSEVGGRTGEIGLLRVRHLDIEGGRVRFEGTSTTDARWAPLTPWGLDQVRRRLAATTDPDEPLIAWARPPKKLQQTCDRAVRETLDAAGLRAPDVRPRSITAWAGRRLLQGEPPMTIDRVARVLGFRSLDECAELVRYDWRDRQ